MTDYEVAKFLGRELDEERAAHTATKADLDAVRAELVALKKAALDLLDRDDFWLHLGRGHFAPAEIDVLNELVGKQPFHTETLP